jgi:hypothetical protein
MKKKVKFAPDDYNRIYAAQIETVLQAIGFSSDNTWVSDESLISDFSFDQDAEVWEENVKKMEAAVRALGVEFDSDTPIWKIAKQLFDKEHN